MAAAAGRKAAGRTRLCNEELEGKEGKGMKGLGDERIRGCREEACVCAHADGRFFAVVLCWEGVDPSL